MIVRLLALPAIVLFCFPILGDDKKVGSPDGSHVTAYSVKLEEKVSGSDGDTETVWEFNLKAFDVPGDKAPRRRIFLIEPLEGKAGPSMPLASMQVRSDGKTTLDLAHPKERIVNDSLVKIVKLPFHIPTSRLKDLQSGKEKIQISNLRLDKKVPVTYEAKPQASNEERLDYRVKLDGDSVVSDYGRFRVELNELSEHFVFDRNDHRWLGGRWNQKHTTTMGDRKTVKESSLEVVELSSTPLSGEEVAMVTEEFELLLPIARVMLPGFVHMEDEEKDGISESLRKYRKGYGEGLLSAALPPIETALIEKLPTLGEMHDPDARSRALLEKTAPEFTLKDLQGNEISLSQFKGNVILLEFWAYR